MHIHPNTWKEEVFTICTVLIGDKGIWMYVCHNIEEGFVNVLCKFVKCLKQQPKTFIEF